MRRDGVVLAAAFLAGLLSTAAALDASPACGWPECAVQRGSGPATGADDGAADEGAADEGAADEAVTGLTAWFDPAAPLGQPQRPSGR